VRRRACRRVVLWRWGERSEGKGSRQVVMQSNCGPRDNRSCCSSSDSERQQMQYSLQRDHSISDQSNKVLRKDRSIGRKMTFTKTHPAQTYRCKMHPYRGGSRCRT
jgi:hypothetical protein